MEIKYLYTLLPISLTVLFVFYYRRFVYNRKWEVKVQSEIDRLNERDKVVLSNLSFDFTDEILDSNIYDFMGQSITHLNSEKSSDFIERLKPIYKEFFATYEVDAYQNSGTGAD
jgi:hypothetical protein